MISAELCREDHGSIPTTAIGRRLEPLDARIDPRTRLNWWWKPKKNVNLKVNIYKIEEYKEKKMGESYSQNIFPSPTKNLIQVL
jgi:hypothetical protein